MYWTREANMFEAMEMIEPHYLSANKFLELVKFHLLSALLLLQQ
jgi:hypothetical protein